jgi:hypothetical protein
VKISNVIAYNAEPRYASIISGIPGHDIEDVTFDNIRIYYRGGGTATQGALEPPEKATDYPEPTMFGEIPAYGFFIRHVRGLEMNGVSIRYLKDDARTPFMISDGKSIDVRNLKLTHSAGSPAFILNDIESFSIRDSYPLEDLRLPNVKQRTIN